MKPGKKYHEAQNHNLQESHSPQTEFAQLPRLMIFTHLLVELHEGLQTAVHPRLSDDHVLCILQL